MCKIYEIYYVQLSHTVYTSAFERYNSTVDIDPPRGLIDIGNLNVVASREKVKQRLKHRHSYSGGLFDWAARGIAIVCLRALRRASNSH